jgi:hypothetical protein
MGGVEVDVEDEVLNEKKWPICHCIGLFMVLPDLAVTKSVVCFCIAWCLLIFVGAFPFHLLYPKQ